MHSARATGGDVVAFVPEARPEAEWSLPSRLGFRFAFVYFVFCNQPFPLPSLPFVGDWLKPYSALRDHVTIWFGAHVLRIAEPISAAQNGSGDRLIDYVFQSLALAVSLVATVIWSLTTRRRSHPVLLAWLCVYLRLVLGLMMMSYGFAKIFKSQFPVPDDGILTKTYGESSPMNLLWTFMGFSTPYTMFAGFMEALPALLLMFRRTTVIASLLLLGVLGNVVVLNLCYDVPVKIYSTQLWLTALFLALPDARRLFAAVVLGRAVPAATTPPPLAVGRSLLVGRVLFALLAAGLAVKTAVENWETYRKYGDGAPVSTIAVRGSFRVTEMTLDGHPLGEIAPERRWTRVWVRSGGIWIYWTDGKGEPFRATGKIVGPGPLDLSAWEDPKHERRGLLDARLDGDTLTLEGAWDGQAVRAVATRIRDEDLLLMKRGFHWVSESPYNR